VDVHARPPRARARAKLLAADDIMLNKNGKNNQFLLLLPSPTAMSTMTTFTVFLLLEPRFIAAAESIVMIFCIWLLFTRFRIVIQSTVFQTAIPAPRATTTKILVKLVLVV
jgi:hypothetical protein